MTSTTTTPERSAGSPQPVGFTLAWIIDELIPAIINRTPCPVPACSTEGEEAEPLTVYSWADTAPFRGEWPQSVVSLQLFRDLIATATSTLHTYHTTGSGAPSGAAGGGEGRADPHPEVNAVQACLDDENGPAVRTFAPVVDCTASGARCFIIGPTRGHSVPLAAALRDRLLSLLQNNADGGVANAARFVFLGDMIDGGPCSIETLSLCFALLIALGPRCVVLLRARHETWFPRPPLRWTGDVLRRLRDEVHTACVLAEQAEAVAAMAGAAIPISAADEAVVGEPQPPQELHAAPNPSDETSPSPHRDTADALSPHHLSQTRRGPDLAVTAGPADIAGDAPKASLLNHSTTSAATATGECAGCDRGKSPSVSAPYEPPMSLTDIVLGDLETLFWHFPAAAVVVTLGPGSAAQCRSDHQQERQSFACIPGGLSPPMLRAHSVEQFARLMSRTAAEALVCMLQRKGHTPAAAAVLAACVDRVPPRAAADRAAGGAAGGCGSFALRHGGFARRAGRHPKDVALTLEAWQLLRDAAAGDPLDEEDDTHAGAAGILFANSPERGEGLCCFSSAALSEFLERTGCCCLLRGSPFFAVTHAQFPDGRGGGAQAGTVSTTGRPYRFKYSPYDPGYRIHRTGGGAQQTCARVHALHAEAARGPDRRFVASREHDDIMTALNAGGPLDLTILAGRTAVGPIGARGSNTNATPPGGAIDRGVTARGALVAALAISPPTSDCGGDTASVGVPMQSTALLLDADALDTQPSVPLDVTLSFATDAATTPGRHGAGTSSRLVAADPTISVGLMDSVYEEAVEDQCPQEAAVAPAIIVSELNPSDMLREQDRDRRPHRDSLTPRANASAALHGESPTATRVVAADTDADCPYPDDSSGHGAALFVDPLETRTGPAKINVAAPILDRAVAAPPPPPLPLATPGSAAWIASRRGLPVVGAVERPLAMLTVFSAPYFGARLLYRNFGCMAEVGTQSAPTPSAKRSGHGGVLPSAIVLRQFSDPAPCLFASNVEEDTLEKVANAAAAVATPSDAVQTTTADAMAPGNASSRVSGEPPGSPPRPQGLTDAVGRFRRLCLYLKQTNQLHLLRANDSGLAALAAPAFA